MELPRVRTLIVPSLCLVGLYRMSKLHVACRVSRSLSSYRTTYSNSNPTPTQPSPNPRLTLAQPSPNPRPTLAEP